MDEYGGMTGTDEDLDELLGDDDDGIRVREDLLRWRDAAVHNYRPHNLWSYLAYIIEDNGRTARAALSGGMAVGVGVAIFTGLTALVTYVIACG